MPSARRTVSSIQAELPCRLSLTLGSSLAVWPKFLVNHHNMMQVSGINTPSPPKAVQRKRIIEL